MKKFLLIPVAALALTLGACQTPDLTHADLPAICKALIGPIRYNTYNKASKRYAAILLGLDLAQRNEVWRRLRCKERTQG